MPSEPMLVAFTASLGLHFGFVIAAWLVAHAPPALDEMSAESVAVDIVSVETFVSASASAVPTEATETLVSAGAEAVPPAAAAAVADTGPARLEAAAPLPAEVLPQLSPLAAAPEVSSSAEVLTASLTEIVPAVSDFSPIADPAAAAVAVAIPAELVPPGEAVSGRLPARASHSVRCVRVRVTSFLHTHLIMMRLPPAVKTLPLYEWVRMELKRVRILGVNALP